MYCGHDILWSNFVSLKWWFNAGGEYLDDSLTPSTLTERVEQK